MNINVKTIVGWSAGLALLMATGCSSTTATQEVNLYSSRHYDTDEILYKNFEQETGIKVNLIEGKADELIERIKNEGANSPADVFIAVDVGRLWRAQEEGILQPTTSEVLAAAIPANLRSDDGHWFGLSKRARVITYNKNKVKSSELSTYEALAEPQWQGRVCIRSSGNIYNQSLVAAKVAQKGEAEAEKWAKGLVNNFAREPEGNDTSQIRAVAAGICDLAVVNHYYVARLSQSDAPEDQDVVTKVGVFFPNQDTGGTHVNISGAGVAANAPHPENAVQFLEYLVSPEAQAIFANANNEYAIVEGVDENPALQQFGDFQESELNVEAYGEKNSNAVKVMDRAGWK